MKAKMRVVGEMPIKRARYKRATCMSFQCFVLIYVIVSHIDGVMTCSVSWHVSRHKSC
jgi:hypothetical protein